jgi:hypothetical protein
MLKQKKFQNFLVKFFFCNKNRFIYRNVHNKILTSELNIFSFNQKDVLEEKLFLI